MQKKLVHYKSASMENTNNKTKSLILCSNYITDWRFGKEEWPKTLRAMTTIEYFKNHVLITLEN